MEVISDILVFILTIAILISFHEFGHFWTARKCGVKVLRFSVGFGKPLKRWFGSDGVEYVIAAIPFGGYVKMLDAREGVVDPAEAHLEFNRKPLLARTAIVAAGPAFNFLLAVILYFLVFIIGVAGMRPIVGELAPGSPAVLAGLMHDDEIIAIDGKALGTWEEVLFSLLRADTGSQTAILLVSRGSGSVQRQITLDLSQINLLNEEGNALQALGIGHAVPKLRPIVDEVVAGSAAAVGGLRAGDEIVAFNDEGINDWLTLVQKIRLAPGQAVELSIKRDGRTLSLPLVIGRSEGEDGEIGQLGVRVKRDETLIARYLTVSRYGIAEALLMSLEKTWSISVLTLKILWRMLTGDAALKNISGPITIADFAGDSFAAGFVSYLSLLALLSISIGILNLLPIPLLDGGHLLYYLVEFVKGSPVSEKTQLFGQKIGISMVGALMLLAFYNDFHRLLN